MVLLLLLCKRILVCFIRWVLYHDMHGTVHGEMGL